MSGVTIKRGDARSAIKATLIEADGSGADLSGATVRFIAADYCGKVLIDRRAQILDALGGQVLVVLEAADVGVAGTYRAEFEVTYSDGRKQTYPNNCYLTIEILPDLG